MAQDLTPSPTPAPVPAPTPASTPAPDDAPPATATADAATSKPLTATGTDSRLLWIAPALGALYGLLIRVGAAWFGPWLRSHGYAHEVAGVMSGGFLLLTPVVMGMITVHARRAQGCSWLFACFGPWVATFMMLLGSMVTLLEGAICVVMMAPLFLGLSSLGGLLMKLLQTLWNLRGRFVGAVAVLPLLALLVEGPMTQADAWQSIRHTVVVDAPPARVWQEILDARGIRPEEMPHTLIHLIGVPRPVEGINRQRPDGEVRESRWERGVHFLGRVTARTEQREIAWRYEFAPDSFPAGTMDDHVVIGGRYFDLGETRFLLTPLDGGRTRLSIEAHYRVSSSVNLYAVPVAALLGEDFVDALLTLYRQRAERPDSRADSRQDPRPAALARAEG